MSIRITRPGARPAARTSGGDSARLSGVELPRHSAGATQLAVRASADRAQVGEPVERVGEHPSQRARVRVARRDEAARIELDLPQQAPAGVDPPGGVLAAEAGELGRGAALPARQHAARPGGWRSPCGRGRAGRRVAARHPAAQPRRERRRAGPDRMQVGGRDHEQRDAARRRAQQPRRISRARANERGSTSCSATASAPLIAAHEPLEVGELGGERRVPAVPRGERRGRARSGSRRRARSIARSRSAGVAGAECLDEPVRAAPPTACTRRSRPAARRRPPRAPPGRTSRARPGARRSARRRTRARARRGRSDTGANRIRGPSPSWRARSRSVSPAGPVPSSTSGHARGRRRPPRAARAAPSRATAARRRARGRRARHRAGMERRIEPEPQRQRRRPARVEAGSTTDITASTSRYARRYQRRSARV